MALIKDFPLCPDKNLKIIKKRTQDNQDDLNPRQDLSTLALAYLAESVYHRTLAF